MNLALKQAQKNLGNTKENPSVGCVIVKNNYMIIGTLENFSQINIPHLQGVIFMKL